ncbi:hypothetical protein FOZ61_005181 [Perkinsus olseni]|uniref:Uncharacterized protein n=1 Tax=Perkinsus olseni TaxID=32597 RepID=A0A7J6MCD3_PEROL|nr:hypothetical protein FOZ61_005181 [Perkinsus olseni]
MATPTTVPYSTTSRGQDRAATSLLHLQPEGTNKAGHWGEMMIQVNLVENRTSGETEVNVKTSGWAHLWFDYAGIGFHYNPAPGNQHFSGTPVVPVSLASVVHVVYLDGKKAWSPWYGIDGFASSKQMELLAIPELHEDSDVPLQVWNVFRIEKVNGGWQFHITFTAAGEEPFTRKIFFFTQNIVDGVLHDRL